MRGLLGDCAMKCETSNGRSYDFSVETGKSDFYVKSQIQV